jgi:hypothetical protein
LLKTALPQAHSVHFAQDHIAARKLRLFNWERNKRKSPVHAHWR